MRFYQLSFIGMFMCCKFFCETRGSYLDEVTLSPLDNYTSLYKALIINRQYAPCGEVIFTISTKPSLSK